MIAARRQAGAGYRPQDAALFPQHQQRIAGHHLRYHPPGHPRRRGGDHRYPSGAGLRGRRARSLSDRPRRAEPRHPRKHSPRQNHHQEQHGKPGGAADPFAAGGAAVGKGEVTGALKIYYCHAHQITNTLKVMAVGLSQIISTQMEVSRIEHLRQMADKAEMRALQSKINPHFLFNALNAISSSIRLNPDTARQLIINLSRYLRYNPGAERRTDRYPQGAASDSGLYRHRTGALRRQADGDLRHRRRRLGAHSEPADPAAGGERHRARHPALQGERWW